MAHFVTIYSSYSETAVIRRSDLGIAARFLMMRIYFWGSYSQKVVAAVIFAVFIAVFYGSTLFHGFVQDDVPVIEKNPYVKSLSYLPKVVTSCLWEYANQGCEGRSFYYRPVQFLSYFLTSQMSFSPWVFHLVNLLYFFAAGFLTFILAKAITKNFTFSLISALVFLAHPINSGVVNWVSAGSDILFVI